MSEVTITVDDAAVRRLLDRLPSRIDTAMRLAMKDATTHIRDQMTTYPPPKGKKKQQGWANRICHEYDHRWNIETGFRDLNRISPPSNARTNLRKFLMFTVRFWIFNAWHLLRAKQRLKRTKKKTKIRETTLRQFSYRTLCLEGCA